MPQCYIKHTLLVMLDNKGKCAVIKYPNCTLLASKISSSRPHFWMLHLRIELQPMADHIDPVALASVSRGKAVPVPCKHGIGQA